MRTLIGNHMKSKWLSQDRATLSKVEDKYIFTIDQMRDVGREAGFRKVQFVNNGEATPSYWQFVVETCRSGGIAPERIEPYKWVDDQFANTCGLMFTEKLLNPDGILRLQEERVGVETRRPRALPRLPFGPSAGLAQLARAADL